MVKFIKVVLFIIPCMLLMHIAYSQSQLTTQGRDFWLSLGRNYEGSTLPIAQVRVAATKKSTVTFTFTELSKTDTMVLNEGAVYTRYLTMEEVQAIYSASAGASGKSLRVQSDEPVAVFVINLEEYTTDATSVLPVSVLGTEYYHLSYSTMAPDGYTLVATEDNTKIYQDSVLVATLYRGEVYSCYFYDPEATGTKITSDKPIAYFTTHACAMVTVMDAACDCLYEQIVPVSLWGTTFMVPVTKRGVERVRILAAQNGTQIIQTGGIPFGGHIDKQGNAYVLNEGQFIELEIRRAEAGCFITANKPVAVASFLTGITYQGLDYEPGDPSMAWVPPIEQTVSNVPIAPFISNRSIITEHYVLLMVQTRYKNLTTMKMGNSPSASLAGGTWSDNASGYSYYSMELTEPDSIYLFENSRGLTAMGYGLGEAESYYYLAASAMRSLDVSFYVNNTHFQLADGKVFCDVDSLSLKAVIYNRGNTPLSQKISWLINGVEETAYQNKLEWVKKPLPVGNYTIQLIVENIGGSIDTLSSAISVVGSPSLDLRDTTICTGNTVTFEVKNPLPDATYHWYTSTNMIANGAICKTPVLTQDTTIRLEVQRAICDNVNEKDIKVKVVNLNVLPVDLPLYNHGEYYQVQLTTNSEQPVFTYTGTLPAGITIDSDGLISGTVPVSEGFQEKVFTVIATDFYGCTAARQYVLKACAPPPVLPDGDSIFYCVDDVATTLRATAQSGLYLQWYADDGVTILKSAPVPSTTVAGVQEYYVAQVNKVLNCVGVKAKITVTVHSLPANNFKVSAATICYGNSPVLLIENAEPTSIYTTYADAGQTTQVGNPLTGVISGNINVNAEPSENVVYYISEKNKFGCLNPIPVPVEVNVTKLVITPYELPSYRNYTQYDQQLSAGANTSAAYSIISGNLPTGLTLSPSGRILGKVSVAGRPENYTFTVQVEDNNNCKGVREYTLSADFFIPTVFSPNGDGINDYFMIGYKVVIFDRLGTIIFEGNNGWDGTYKGKPAPADIYYYKLYQDNAVGKTEIKTGYIGLQR